MSTKREGVPAFEKADPDEPIFVLRAQDTIAPEVVLLWAQTALMRDVSRDKVREARACAADMIVWQLLHGSKVPD